MKNHLFTLSKTNEDVEIDEKKTTSSFVFWKRPDKCSNIYVSLQMWVLHRKPKSYVRGFLWFYICNTLSKIYVSGFASWQIQMNIYVSGFVMYVALNFQHLC